MILKELNSLKEVNSIKCSNCYTNFGGTNERVDVTTSALDTFVHTNPLTISVWVYLRSDSSNIYAVLSKYNLATNIGFYFILFGGGHPSFPGRMRWQMRPNAFFYLDVYSTNLVPTDEWCHIAITLSGNGRISGTNFYINGVNAVTLPTGTDTISGGSVINAEDLEIGSVTDFSYFTEGGMEDLAIFNRELSEGEIQQIYSRGRFGASYADIANLVSFYEMSSIDPRDIVGGYDGTSVNMDEGDITCTGLPINCYTTLNGLNEYMRGGNGTPYDFEWTDSFSISIWLESSLSDAVNMLISKWFNQTGWFVYSSSLGTIVFQIRSGQYLATRCLEVSASSVLPLTGLNNLIITYDGTGVIGGCGLYINGVSTPFTVASVTPISTGTIKSASSNLEFGASTSLGYYLDGNLHDVKIWKKVLTLDEITQEYNLGDIPNDRPVDFPNLVAWNRCGEEVYYTASTPIFEDSSGAGADFTGINIDSTNIKCE